MRYEVLLRDKRLLKEYEKTIKKFDLNKKKIFINYFVYWCALKNIDARVCGVVILNYLMTLSFINSDEINILKELCDSIKDIIEKDRLLAYEEERAYNQMSDIAFIIKIKLKLDNKSHDCYLIRRGIRCEIKNLINKYISILKKYFNKIFK